MFIVKKEIKGKDYFYLRESKREGGKVKSKTLAYLGKTREEAEVKMKEFKSGKDENKVVSEKKIEKVEKVENQEKPKEMKELKELTIEEITNFCKRKGFVYPSAEIYGGLSGFWDLGPMGVELMNNIKKEWWNYFVYQKENMAGIDASIITNPKVWKASGHLASFSDVSVRCKKCKKYNKVDKAELETAKCSFCQGELDKASAKELNMMLKTQIGPIEEDSIIAYLRPEDAQGMFTNFKLVQETSRMKLPFGIAQIGKCFRNEIAPRDFLFRLREFNLAEFEFFIHPQELKCSLLDKEHLNLKIRFLNAETQEKGGKELEDLSISKILEEKRLDEWHAYWLAEQILFYKKLGIDTGKIKIREHMRGELSHYSSATFDIDYEYPFGSKELGGNANRGQYDLTQHAKESNQKLDYFDEESKSRVVPRVIEPTFGLERIFLAAIVGGYIFDEKRQNIVLKLNPKLAPIKAAIFPIVKVDEQMVKLSREVYDNLKQEFHVSYDDSGSVGRRYSRNDEIGTVACITVDEQSLKDNTATVRDRDTTEQVRVKIPELREILRKVINEGRSIIEFGKRVNTRVKEE